MENSLRHVIKLPGVAKFENESSDRHQICPGKCCGSGYPNPDPHYDYGTLDPDTYWECGSGSRNKETDQNLQINSITSAQVYYLHKVSIFLM
jgi:hypothetical protein